MLLKDLISEYVKLHDLSYRAFAKQCGLSPAYLSMIMAGNNPSTGKPPIVSMPKLYKIATGMGITLHQLAQTVDDMPVTIDDENGSSHKGATAVDPKRADTFLSQRGIFVARAYEKMSAYGRAIIDVVIEQETLRKTASSMEMLSSAEFDPTGEQQAKIYALLRERELKAFSTTHDSDVYDQYHAKQELKELQKEMQNEDSEIAKHNT